MKFFALSSERCSSYVKQECEKLSLSNINQKRGGVSFESSLRDAERFCLHSFFSTRLLLEIAEKDNITSADDIYAFASTIKWEEWISSKDKTFLITANSEDASWCKNAAGVSLKLKDAICDREREVFGERSSVDKENPDVTFHLFINRNTATIYVDFSSRALSKRHYRVENTPVYLQENIASALLAFSPFVTLLEKDKLLSVVDPFVGSGTILIEAALLASGSVPGLIDKDRYAFLRLPIFNKDEWDDLIQIEEENDRRSKDEFRKRRGDVPIFFGYDIDEKMLDAAVANARKAGVDEFISFQKKDATELTKDDIPKGACIVTDPPYGKRLDSANLVPLYYKFTKNLEKIIDGGSLTLITVSDELTNVIPYEDKRVFHLQNGAITCNIINKKFISSEELKELALKREEERKKRLSSPLRPQALSLFNTLVKRKKEFDEYFKTKGVTSYRLYDGGIVPFNYAIDIFDDHFAVISEYSSKQDDERRNSFEKVDELKSILFRLGFDDENHIYVKLRKRMDKGEQYTKNEKSGEKYVIKEHGLNFLLNFDTYIDNGLFLDSRLLREKIYSLSKDKRFLNLFCYTGSATVHAASGGALSTVSVDSSNTYLSWAKDNMRINDFDTMNHFYYAKDAIEFLKSLDRRTKFDLVFLDPPTFSNSHSRNSFDIQKDHEFMIMLIMKHLERDGKLIFCTNFRDFEMSKRTMDYYSVKETSSETIDIDFKDRKYPIHKSFEITHKRRVYE